MVSSICQFNYRIGTEAISPSGCAGFASFWSGFFVVESINYGKRAAEAEPHKVFQAVFDTPPTPDVRALRGYYDGDELGHAFLAFRASPKTVAKLTAGKFKSLSPAQKSIVTIDDYYWKNPPTWFNTQVTKQTQVYRVKDTSADSNYLLFYEPPSETVRVYFEVLGIDRFRNQN